MKCDILLEMLFDLLAQRKLTAKYFAEKYEMSVRSVYRYVDVLSLSVPVQVTQGRNGGISISDAYKLPAGYMKKEEYEACVDALDAVYSQLKDERFVKAKAKLTSQMKKESRTFSVSGTSSTLVVDGGTWGDTRDFSEKIAYLESCIHESRLIEIDYQSRIGEISHRKIEPHVLILKQGVWYIYAYCRRQKDWRTFKIGRILSMVGSDELFERKEIKREDIPLNYWTEDDSVRIRLEIGKDGFADAQDWLGAENLKMSNGKWYAEANLPNDEILLRKILSLGADVKVLAPVSLQEKIRELATAVLKNY